MRTKTPIILCLVLLTAGLAAADDVRPAVEPAATPEPQDVEPQTSVSEVASLPVERPSPAGDGGDCVVMLALYFAGDPSMSGVSLFEILATCG